MTNYQSDVMNKGTEQCLRAEQAMYFTFTALLQMRYMTTMTLGNTQIY